jgi:hypothetical protein
MENVRLTSSELQIACPGEQRRTAAVDDLFGLHGDLSTLGDLGLGLLSYNGVPRYNKLICHRMSKK